MSDCTSSDATKSCIQALLSALRRLTMGTDLPQFAHAVHRNRGPCNLPRGVYGAIVEMLTDLVTRPAQREPKEQKFGMVFYDTVPPWSVALGDPAVRVGRTTPLSRTVAARSWNQEKTGYWIGLPEALHTIRATRIPDLVAWQNSQTL